MKGLPIVPAGWIYTLDPARVVGADLPLETQIPAQQDELPQGVLDLLAMLVVRPRPPSAGQAAPLTADAPASAAEPAPEPRPLPLPVAVPERRFDLPARLVSFAPTLAADSPQPSTEPLPGRVEPLVIERTAVAPALAVPVGEAPVPEVNLQAPRNVPVITSPTVPLPSAPLPRAALEVNIEVPPGPSPGLLQVPFNKGVASGQVTISREFDEPARPLLLSPSNPQVFDQLKAPLEQLREPAWRLTDQRGEQQRQGSRQSPDDEPSESST